MKQSYHVLMLLENAFPPDIRVEKEMDALTTHDYEVSVLCHRKSSKKTNAKYKNVTVFNYVSRSLFNRLKTKLTMYLTFIQPDFLSEMKSIYEKNPFHIIHVHDLPLAKTALIFKQNHQPNVKVILDFHENYTEALLVWNEWNKGLKASINKLIFNRYKRWLHYEKKVIVEADHVIAVVKEMKDRLISAHNVSDSHISVISNTEPESFDTLPVDQTIISQFKDQFIVSYIGGFGPHRGIDTAILGMSKLSKNINIKLLLVGKGNKIIESKFRSLIESYDLNDRVIMLGWQPFEKVSSYIAASSVCLVPHKNNPHTGNTVPHKLFQYMIKGKPVLVSSCAPLKRIVEETQSGLVFKADDPQDFAEKLLDFVKNPELLNHASEKGKLATSTGIYTWENDAKSLLDAYKSLTT